METLLTRPISTEPLMQKVQQLEDELAIRRLTNQYADAANRIDAKLFYSLWTEEAEWIIGPPINQQFFGREQIVDAFVHLLHSWDFFVQLPVGGNLHIEEDRARAYFYVNEIARSKDGRGNYNLSMYEDELVKRDGQWYFRKRNYRVIYLDEKPLEGKSFPLSHLQHTT